MHNHAIFVLRLIWHLARFLILGSSVLAFSVLNAETESPRFKLLPSHVDGRQNLEI